MQVLSTNFLRFKLILDKETNPLFDFPVVHCLAFTQDGRLLITDYKRNGKRRLFIFAFFLCWFLTICVIFCCLSVIFQHVCFF